MNRSALDQLRDANPHPDALTAPPVESLLSRLEPRSDPPRPTRRRPSRAAWAVPAAGVLVALTILILAVDSDRRAQPGATAPAAAQRGSGPLWRIPAADYPFAVGGDISIRTSSAETHSGLLLFRADQILRQRCMSRRGLHYVLDPTPAAGLLPSNTGFPSTFYPQPIASAYPEGTLVRFREQHGFSLSGSSGERDPDDAYVKTLTPEHRRQWINALDGPGGCSGSAEAELFGSRALANEEMSVPTDVYDYLNSTVYRRDGTSPKPGTAAATVTRAWSRCMRRATGGTWADENALLFNVTGRHRPSTHGERRLAVADARCAYSTGQAELFARTFRAAADRLPSQLQAELKLLLARRPGWIAHARAIMGSTR